MVNSSVPQSNPSRRLPTWVLVLWALVAIIALAVAIAGRSDGTTLRAIAVSPSMSETDAQNAAERTALAWVRERNAGHRANVRELTCSEPPKGWVRDQLTFVTHSDSPPPSANQWKLAALTGFQRAGDEWTINALAPDQGGMLVMRIEDGRLRVCALEPVPVPTG